jgi:succinylglutamate desuccinylase
MGYRAAVILAGLLGCLPAHAEIYRWVDEQGQVHFDQRPRAGAESVVVNPQIVERDDRMRQSEDNMRRLMDLREQERETARETRAVQQQRAQQRCAQMRSRLERYGKRTYWYETDATGRQVEVSRERLEQARVTLQRKIAEEC